MSRYNSSYHTVIDFSDQNVQDLINSTYAMLSERPMEASDELSKDTIPVIADVLSQVVVTRQNVKCGLNAVYDSPAYSVLKGSINSLKKLDEACSTHLKAVRENNCIEVHFIAQIALCHSYGWFSGNDCLSEAEDILNRLRAENQFSSSTEREYVNGLKAYFSMKRRGKWGYRREYQCSSDNPWLAVAAFELKHGGRGWLFGRSVRMMCNNAIHSPFFRYFDPHTQKRLRFMDNYETFLWDGTWNDSLALGLYSGVKLDADLSVSTILDIGRAGKFELFFADAAFLGYKSVSSLIISLLQRNLISGRHLFHWYICALNNPDVAYIYASDIYDKYPDEALDIMRKYGSDGYSEAQSYLADKLKERHQDEESLEWRTALAENDETAKVKLFEDLSDLCRTNKSYEQRTVDSAVDVFNSSSRAAFWLGEYYFSEGQYEEAVKYLSVGCRQNHAPSKQLLARCLLNGYGTEEDCKKAYEHLVSVYDIAELETKMLRIFCKVGGVGTHVNIKSAMQVYEEINKTDSTLSAFFDALLILGKLRRNRRYRRFWNSIWAFAEKHSRLSVLNTAGRLEVYKNFVELSGALIALGWVNARSSVGDVLSAFKAAEETGSLISRTILEFYREEKPLVPNIIGKLKMAVNPYYRKKMYSQILRYIETSMNTRLLPALCEQYSINSEEFERIAPYVPWGEALCKILEGMRLMGLSQSSSDEWSRKKYITKSAEAGDGRAALELYDMMPLKRSPEALVNLDNALSCGMAQAYKKAAYLSYGDSYNLYLRGVYAGCSRCAVDIQPLAEKSLFRLMLLRQLERSIPRKDI